MEGNFGAGDDGLDGALFHVRPQPDDIGIGGSPRVHQGFEFFLFESHFEGAHGFQCADGPVVAAGQFGDFPFWRRSALGPCLPTGTPNIWDAD